MTIRPPILEAAVRGVLEIVEWFEGDAPLRCYKHFADSHLEDRRIKQLEHHQGGFERMVKQFLGTHAELALHCAVISNDGKRVDGQSPRSIDLLKHLIREMPDSVNLKSEEGFTPLHIAFALCQEQDAKHLIEAGADQTIRTKKGRNILHMLFWQTPECNKAKPHLEAIRRMLNLVDKRLLSHLCQERSAAVDHTRTPFAQWLTRICGSDHELEVGRLLLGVSKGVELGFIDGQGDTPLHTALKRDNPAVCKLIIEYDPRLIHRENATGRTPYEQVEDRMLSTYLSLAGHAAEQTGSRGMNGQFRYSNSRTVDLTARPSEEFLEEPKDEQSALDEIWQIMQDTKSQLEARGESKRTLVGLNEANEVARRLIATRAQQSPTEQESEEKQSSWLAKDVVKLWFGNALPTYTRASPDWEW